MIGVEDLKHFNTGFEIGDIFGKGRMKELIFDMKERLCYDKSEIEKWQLIAADEAKMITKLYDQLEGQSYEAELRRENAELSAKLERALEMQKSLEEYSASLKKQLDDVHYSDTEVYRILSAMRAKKPNEWLQEEVS